jgi:N-acetylglucosaminyldiphosphoundecaprenol N-acetyl-beta-D-mannosaminyltransferase
LRSLDRHEADYPNEWLTREAREDDLESRAIVGMRVDVTSYEDAASRIVKWAELEQSRYVCVASVNNVMEARDDDGFLEIMNKADLVTPDGMPLVWGLRLLGASGATRVYGPDLTPVVLTKANEHDVPVGFYGGSPEVLDAFVDRVREGWPQLNIAYRCSPPFTALSSEEEKLEEAEISASGTRILFVGIGCPKQEFWMARRKGKLPCVMVGVGAAFDFISGTKRQAPRWMRRAGLEWLFRLITEPSRLWRRYLRQNPRFVALFGAQLLRARKQRGLATSD